MTAEMKRAIKRICNDYDFENTKELKEYLFDQYGDRLDQYWFSGTTEDDCYKELQKAVDFIN